VGLGIRDLLNHNPQSHIKEVTMRKIFFALLSLFLITGITACTSKKDLELEGKKLISRKPPFTLILPSEFILVHSFSHENPTEHSLTRAFFFIKEKDKKVEEMLILQIADKTNPQAGPMTAAPLKPYEEKRLYSKGKVKKGELEVDYLLQLMAWNPDASSLQPIVKKGFVIPSCWALQGQSLFLYQGEHAVFFRYSKNVNSFGMKVSEKGEDWEKGRISENEKKVYETFQKSFKEMIDSIQIKSP
jgi:hypothetical protein